MSISIITNCSSRKRDIGVAPLVPAHLEATSLAELPRLWVDGIRRASVRVTPMDLYQGRAFAECRAASRLTSAQLYVISAGLGMVHADDLVPSYSLTISEGSGSLQKWMSNQNVSSADWWQALCESLETPNPVSNLINAQPIASQTLIALPASYLEMVVPDIDMVQPHRLESIRFFTSDAGVRVLPLRLRTAVMPYDDRLEGIANHDGTRNDFPHRALKHFVTRLQGHHLSIDSAKKSVQRAMDSSVKRILPKRGRATDEQIMELVRTNWSDYDGSASRLLRYLRDDAKVACEQSRFSGLWRRIRENVLSQGVLNG